MLTEEHPEANTKYKYKCFELKTDHISVFAGSAEYLTGTRIVISGELTLHCEYNPPLARENLTGLKQVTCLQYFQSFSYLVSDCLQSFNWKQWANWGQKNLNSIFSVACFKM